jgi:hypothetical protein
MEPVEEGCLERVFRMALWLGAALLIVAIVLVILGRRPMRIDG